MRVCLNFGSRSSYDEKGQSCNLFGQTKMTIMHDLMGYVICVLVILMINKSEFFLTVSLFFLLGLHLALGCPDRKNV